MALLWAARGYVSKNGTRQLVVMTDEPDPLLMPSFRWFLLASLATIVVAALVAGRVSRSLTGPSGHPVMSPDASPPATLAAHPRRSSAGRTRSASWSPRSTRWRQPPTIERTRTVLMSVSHDLRTPLTSIKGYAEALTDGAIVDHQQAGQSSRPG